MRAESDLPTPIGGLQVHNGAGYGYGTRPPPEDLLRHAKSARPSVCRGHRISPCDGRHQCAWFETLVGCDCQRYRAQSAPSIGQESAPAVAHRAEGYRGGAGHSPNADCENGSINEAPSLVRGPCRSARSRRGGWLECRGGGYQCAANKVALQASGLEIRDPPGRRRIQPQFWGHPYRLQLASASVTSLTTVASHDPGPRRPETWYAEKPPPGCYLGCTPASFETVCGLGADWPTVRSALPRCTLRLGTVHPAQDCLIEHR
jgi:hypothetical protein